MLLSFNYLVLFLFPYNWVFLENDYVPFLYFQSLALTLTCSGWMLNTGSEQINEGNRVDFWDLFLGFLDLQVASIWDFESWFRVDKVKVGEEQEDRWIWKEFNCGG